MLMIAALYYASNSIRYEFDNQRNTNWTESAMPLSDLAARYRRLDAPSRHLVQLYAVCDEAMSRQEVLALSKQTGWTDGRGKPLTLTAAGQLVNSLQRKDLLVRGSYSSVRVNASVRDLAIQDSIERESFEPLYQAVKAQPTRPYYRATRTTRNLRLAFYGGDVKTCQSLTKGKNLDPDARLLEPFNRDIFDRFDPILREMYLADILPRLIKEPSGDGQVLTAFDQMIESLESPGDDFIASWLDLVIARGDLDSLRQLDKQTGHKLKEVTGCLALLQGDFEQAEDCLRVVMPGGSRKRSLAIGRLPAVLYALLLFRKDSAASLVEAKSIVSSATKAKKGRYAGLMEAVAAAISFKLSPSSPSIFAKQLKRLCRSPLEAWLAGYFSNWLLTADETPFQVRGLVQIANAYRAAGLDWLAAEVFGLAGKANLKTAAAQRTRHSETHGRLGTVSLVDLMEPEPAWQRSLNAIAELVEPNPTNAAPADTQQNERLIWELAAGYESICLDVYHQKRSAGGWSKGRKVGAQRLYDQFNDPEFAFLTEQDREICRSLETWTERNGYGYRETYYEFDDVRAARALIGHPCVFRPGKREKPTRSCRTATAPECVGGKGRPH